MSFREGSSSINIPADPFLNSAENSYHEDNTHPMTVSSFSRLPFRGDDDDYVGVRRGGGGSPYLSSPSSYGAAAADAGGVSSGSRGSGPISAGVSGGEADGGVATFDELPRAPVPWYRSMFSASNLLMLVLMLYVIAAGAVNRVLYKIQILPLATSCESPPAGQEGCRWYSGVDGHCHNYLLFVSWVLSGAYLIVYGSCFAVAYLTGQLTRAHVRYIFTLRGTKLILMGACDALGFVFGLFAAKYISGYLLTLLPQGIIPMTMLLTVVIVGTYYNVGQVLGATVLILGIVLSLVPSIQDGASASIIWGVVYFFSSSPNALSFVLREMVFKDDPSMNIFVVNTMDSLWQFIFSWLLFPVVAIPGFGGVPFADLGHYFPDGAKCLFAGIAPYEGDSCYGEPYLTIIYVSINITWNISILMLLKRGGAVLSFIAGAVSLPIAHLAFAIRWPLQCSAETLHWVDLVALVVVLLGLVLYRLFSMWQARRMEHWRQRRMLEGRGPPPHPFVWLYELVADRRRGSAPGEGQKLL